MNTRKRRIAAILVMLAGLAILAVPIIEAQTDYRFTFPFGIRTNNTGASLFVRQDGSGSIATLRDGATDEYTFDQSGATFVNPLTMSGGAALTGHLTLATAPASAGAATTPIVPGGVLQPVSMATAGIRPITIPAAGTFVCIYNTGSEVVSIDDTSTQVLSTGGTPMPLGQYDTLCGISDGTRFIQTTRSDN